MKVVVRVRPVNANRLTRWAVSCNECRHDYDPQLTKQAAEIFANTHVRDRHEGRAVVAVRKPQSR
jgi:hypothetical protein